MHQSIGIIREECQVSGVKLSETPPSLERICRAGKMTADGFYKYKKREKDNKVRDEHVLAKVKTIRQEQPRIGTRKLSFMLRQEWIATERLIGRDKLFTLLRENNLLIKKRKKKVPQTTYSNHVYAVVPNLLKEEVIIRPEQAVVADITYVRVGDGFAYLFLITDKYSRMILGAHLSKDLGNIGAKKALEKACAIMQITEGVIHHTDRGVQYCCHEFQQVLKKYKMRPSMTDENHAAQNAIAERINGILKSEFFIDSRFHNFEQAKTAIDSAVYIYNYRRPHCSLGLETPASVHFRGIESPLLVA